MIFEALSTLKDTNGSDIGAILNFIEVRWRSLVICVNLVQYICSNVPSNKHA